MAKVIENKQVGENIFLLSIEYKGICKMGQFFMIRAWDNFPILSRPISVFDYEDDKLSLLYQVIGKGTKLMSKLDKSDEVIIEGPFGNGFPYINEGDITLIGGGVGIAPLYFAGKEIYRLNSKRNIHIYIGTRKDNDILGYFRNEFSNIDVKVGGIITDYVDFSKGEIIFTCGPEIMMKKITQQGISNNKKVYISVEKNMACGVGACLGCTCKTKDGNKRVCKDGPVFLGEDFIYE